MSPQLTVHDKRNSLKLLSQRFKVRKGVLPFSVTPLLRLRRLQTKEGHKRWHRSIPDAVNLKLVFYSLVWDPIGTQ